MYIVSICKWANAHKTDNWKQNLQHSYEMKKKKLHVYNCCVVVVVYFSFHKMKTCVGCRWGLIMCLQVKEVNIISQFIFHMNIVVFIMCFFFFISPLFWSSFDIYKFKNVHPTKLVLWPKSWNCKHSESCIFREFAKFFDNYFNHHSIQHCLFIYISFLYFFFFYFICSRFYVILWCACVVHWSDCKQTFFLFSFSSQFFFSISVYSLIMTCISFWN